MPGLPPGVAANEKLTAMIAEDDAATIARTFDLGLHPQLEGPVARGEVGQIWKLTTTTGRWAIKEAFEPPSPTEAEHDASFQELVQSAGVNVPTVRRAHGGRVLAEVNGSLVRAYSWVDLSATDPSIDPVQVGRVVASIHRVLHHDANGVDPWYTDPVGGDQWNELIAASRWARAPFADQLAEQQHDLIALEALPRPPTQLQACHRDLFADNVLSTPGGDLCVIDWENSGLADPSHELALVLFEYSRGDSARSRLLYDSYISSGGPGRVRDPGDFSMLIAQLGHICEIACQRWLDPTRVNERERNQARIDEFLTDRLTTTTIDEILDAIGTQR